MSDFSFKVVVIESLPPSDKFNSGKELYKFLVGLTHDDIRESPATLFSVVNAGEFRDLIRKLATEAHAKRENYILHIETHGLYDTSGILFADKKSSISWNELSSLLVPLNRATRFNLLVCVAACFGGYFLREVRPEVPAPCWGIIGPTDITNGPELLNRFRMFYRQLFNAADSTIEIEALLRSPLDHGCFLVRSVDDWFQRLFESYFKDHCTKDAIERRVSSMVAEANALGTDIPREVIRECLKEKNSLLIDEFFNSFFMTADVPENIIRYADLLSSGRLEIKRFLDTQNF